MVREPEAVENPPVGAPSSEPAPDVADIAEILLVLADPIRLRIVRALADGEQERSCGAFDLPVTKSTLTHHFRALRDAGFIGWRYEGTRKFIHLRRADLDAAYPGLIDSVLQDRRGTSVNAR